MFFEILVLVSPKSLTIVSDIFRTNLRKWVKYLIRKSEDEGICLFY